ncbi:MAG: hypothetical protein A2315_12480 [Ignavibacteria bacterium RIFOXYB2_FULL_35_12]|nr:MAG: hypothetical protein A2058_04010 [Ignavibacteria bacterium GWA2_36_19]OGU59197.1 MAG: hypothetical protein A2X60_17545 [Ignavibacteria bacterium GWF2_35_20]OGU79123.1 MAG: hypothetical protein A2254_11905 [Ignavibacteria bacterium RIFOXYA2_FULL_35_9]OGU84765.1 MAG: hypothetical protein A3K31_03580 [Ignavibacteria bacterium RIFOXYA12_FULL_35_25]OGU88787.1 MAG: hypothetical protein A2492_09120 [Ignavibacteria bacterium RIFOXYC12_FULL_35_11]OGU97939.1 MAG: hypothetical protein A2347_06100
MKKAFLVSFFFLIVSNILIAQVTEQTLKYRNDPYGNKTFRKKGIMDGNQIRTLFRNDGQIGSWPDRPSGEWPKGTGHHYLDGCTPIVSTRLETAVGVVHPALTSYREEVDVDPATGQLWVMEPVPGYNNPGSEIPAISTNPATWPEIWPRTLPLITPAWDGYWFGYFGRGVQNAEFETFYVMDDSQDKEYNRPPYSFYPVLSDNARGGVGIREEVRGFQWSHVLAEDIIFWHFDIINLSDFDRDSTIFGFYADTGVGGVEDNADDNANYSTLLDLTYAFDADGVAPPNKWKTGYVGYAYLESPGNALNGIDDDEDGMIDERRDDGIDNDGDWRPYLDLNGNGKWDAGENEPLNDDVGEDGVGPFDPQYKGPDTGEGNGIPTNGEPNFDKTDKDESDQIGLTSLKIDRLDNKGPLSIWPKNDEYIWNNLLQGNFDTTVQKANIQIAFGSGPFPLKLNTQERFSVALVFGSDFEDMVFNKETVQQIYNANYNFTKPPLKPTLQAVAGDKKVFLYWNSISEQSRDPFLGFEQNDPTLGYKKDFEGYLIYRSEEPEFNDIKTITDSKGEPKFYKPIAQFDLIDGIGGPDPIGVNGAHFWRGDDVGLQHSYIDEDVVNGKTYYYACVAYDQGDPNFGTAGLMSTETTKIITQDLVGNIQFIDINCAIITPNAPAAGYIPPAINPDVIQLTGLGTGAIDIVVLDGSLIKDGATYKVLFNSTGNIPVYKTDSYSVVREFSSVVDTLDVNGGASNLGTGKYSSPFDGIAISMSNYDSVIVDLDNSGWIKGFCTLYMPVTPDRSNVQRNIAWPSDYEIEWLADKSVITPFTKIPINFKVRNLTRGDTVQAEILDINKSKTFDLGDEIVIIEYVGTAYKLTWNIGYYPPISIPYIVHPSAGDKFRVSTHRPYATGDYFTFSTTSSKVDNNTAKNSLDKIGIVPNPYISANAWERRNLNQTGRGERRIDFINLPAKCEIRIYTLTGALIKTLNKDSSPIEGAISWNLVTDDGMDIAYGVYVYHVDAPEIGEKIGKFAIIK